MSQSMDNIFHNLEGEWSIRRKLGDIGEAEGRARFLQVSGDSNVLSYEEKLEITFFGSDKHQGHQEYKFIYDPERNSISKYNSSGVFMYQLQFSDNEAYGEYLCDKDKYIATYIFLDGKFTLTYEVSGPNKNYSIITEFERIVGDVAGASSDLFSFSHDSF